MDLISVLQFLLSPGLGSWPLSSMPGDRRNNKTRRRSHKNDEMSTETNATNWMGRRWNLKIKVIPILILTKIFPSVHKTCHFKTERYANIKTLYIKKIMKKETIGLQLVQGKLNCFPAYIGRGKLQWTITVLWRLCYDDDDYNENKSMKANCRFLNRFQLEVNICNSRHLVVDLLRYCQRYETTN